MILAWASPFNARPAIKKSLTNGMPGSGKVINLPWCVRDGDPVLV